MKDCTVEGCHWRNGFKSCQDGSREAEAHFHRSYHENGGEPVPEPDYTGPSYYDL